MSMRPLPHFADGEIAILAACLIDNDTVPQVVDALAPDDFYNARHRIIFEAIASAA